MNQIDAGREIKRRSRNSKRFAKKHAVTIDMTPMVDLGFLLISFFIFTTTMSSPVAMNLNVPNENEGHTTKIKVSSVLTILLGENDQVFYYEGSSDTAHVHASNYSDIRKEIIRKKQQVIQNHVHDSNCSAIQAAAKKAGESDWQNACDDKDYFVIIKPGNHSTYKNLVDALDEMIICNVKRYTLDGVTEQDQKNAGGISAGKLSSL